MGVDDLLCHFKVLSETGATEVGEMGLAGIIFREMCLVVLLNNTSGTRNCGDCRGNESSDKYHGNILVKSRKVWKV